MTEILDEYAGQGGRYEIIDGKRVRTEEPTREGPAPSADQSDQPTTAPADIKRKG